MLALWEKTKRDYFKQLNNKVVSDNKKFWQAISPLENINLGIQFYNKENSKKHQFFLESNKILNIILKNYIFGLTFQSP